MPSILLRLLILKLLFPTDTREVTQEPHPKYISIITQSGSFSFHFWSMWFPSLMKIQMQGSVHGSPLIAAASMESGSLYLTGGLVGELAESNKSKSQGIFLFKKYKSGWRSVFGWPQEGIAALLWGNTPCNWLDKRCTGFRMTPLPRNLRVHKRGFVIKMNIFNLFCGGAYRFFFPPFFPGLIVLSLQHRHSASRVRSDLCRGSQRRKKIMLCNDFYNNGC